MNPAIKNILTVLAVVAIAVVVATLVKGINIDNSSSSSSDGNSNTNDSDSSAGASSSSSAHATSTATAVSGGWPIGKGSGSRAHPDGNVKSVQQAVNWYRKGDIDVDGIWGDQTENALKQLRDKKYWEKSFGALVQRSFADLLPMDGGKISLDKNAYQKFIEVYATHKANNKNENFV